MTLSSWSPDNRVIEQGKVVTYSKHKVIGKVDFWNIGYEYHRYCTATYKYVGMDYDTSLSCADNMISVYTRNYTEPYFQNGTYMNLSAGFRCMADIAVLQTDGPIYQVVVQIREDDTKMSLYSRTDLSAISALFAAENARYYDGIDGVEPEEEEA